MIPVDLPQPTELITLADERHPSSVTVYLPSSPVSSETAAVKLSLKNATSTVRKALVERGADATEVASVIDPLESLDDDLEFWQNQSRSLAILATPDRFSVFRIANRVAERVVVADRLDVGPLLRAVTFANSGFVVTVTANPADVRLIELSAESRPRERALELPGDLSSVLEHAENHGQADMPRSQGTTGQRIEHQRYCRIIDEAVGRVIGATTTPVILAASDDFEPAYRAVSTLRSLLARGIDAHPSSLSANDIDDRARGILDAHYAGGLAEWNEDFGSRRAGGRASSDVAELARAATAGAIEEIHFDMDADVRGMVDGSGLLTEPGSGDDVSGTYNVIDEIASRALRSGATVRAVREADLPDASPVAATLRFPL
ncbi:hypothetical protein [Marisediminicola sp. LYQ134]|uniref:baeRF11 domain-containing protein n=1 Tax=unclassified Marisediminicola TaxID=2618316 RepID=UPI003982EC75